MSYIIPEDNLNLTQKDIKFKNHPFQSNVARIIATHINTNNPGPGSYNLNIDNYKLNNIKRGRKLNLPHQFDWIINQQNRINGLKSSENNKYVAPNSYQIKIKSKSPNYSWGKSSRFNIKLDQSTHLGPGYYNYQSKSEISGGQAVFKSSVPKNSMFVTEQRPVINEHIFTKLNSSNIIDKSDLPRSEKFEKSSVFASKVPRFKDRVDEQYSSLGPGSYDLQKQLKSRSKKRKISIQTSQQSLSKTENKQLGPGCYEIGNDTFGTYLQKKGFALSKETRFNFRSKKTHSTILPGPGQYLDNQGKRLAKIKPQSHLHKRLNSINTNNLKNKQKRGESSLKSSPGFYDLKMFEMSYQIQKKKQYMQNLKSLKVRLAPFDSKVNRLS